MRLPIKKEALEQASFAVAPRTGFEPVTYRLTVGSLQKYRSVDLMWLEKPVHTIVKCESTKKLSGHNTTEPVAHCCYQALYHTLMQATLLSRVARRISLAPETLHAKQK